MCIPVAQFPLCGQPRESVYSSSPISSLWTVQRECVFQWPNFLSVGSPERVCIPVAQFPLCGQPGESVYSSGQIFSMWTAQRECVFQWPNFLSMGSPERVYSSGQISSMWTAQRECVFQWPNFLSMGSPERVYSSGQISSMWTAQRECVFQWPNFLYVGSPRECIPVAKFPIYIHTVSTGKLSSLLTSVSTFNTSTYPTFSLRFKVKFKHSYLRSSYFYPFCNVYYTVAVHPSSWLPTSIYTIVAWLADKIMASCLGLKRLLTLNCNFHLCSSWDQMNTQDIGYALFSPQTVIYECYLQNVLCPFKTFRFCII